LAHSDNLPIAALLIRRGASGLQFHPEVAHARGATS
jgi:GMP synthase-like glutamine amidotransferase